MKFYRLLLIKAYFDKGLGLTNYFKYILAFVGIFQLINAKTGIILALSYIIFCLLLGWIWYKYQLIETENEINNIYNPFQREVRERLSKKRFK